MTLCYLMLNTRGGMYELWRAVVFFWVKERLIVPVATQQLKDVGMSCTRGYPIPAVARRVRARV
jgi:hypothetical protein